jgi:hypothetical protein
MPGGTTNMTGCASNQNERRLLKRLGKGLKHAHRCIAIAHTGDETVITRVFEGAQGLDRHYYADDLGAVP